MKRRFSIGISLSILYGSILFLGIPVFHPAFLKPWFNATSFYIIWILFLLWIFSLAEIIKKDCLRLSWHSFKNHWLTILLPLLFGILIFYSIPPYFRILSDETNLLAVSQNMLHQHGINNVTMGFWYDWGFHGTNYEFEKRPLLFPFFTFLIHLVRGYHPENAFVLNFLVLTGLLGLLFKITAKFLGTIGAIASLILIVSQPVVSQTATSAGFDLFSVFLLFLCFIALEKFLREPDTISFQWLWFNLLMLSYIRHESMLVLIITVTILFSARKIQPSFFQGPRSWLFALTPLLLAPRIWQYHIRAGIPNTYETAAGDTGFSLLHWADHIRLFFTTFLRFDYFLPYATAINWIGSIAIVLFVLEYRNKSRNDTIGQLLFFITSLVFLSLINVMFAFHIGDPTHPVSSRYFLLPFILLSVFAVWGMQRLSIFQKNQVFLIIVSTGLFLLYHPVSIKNDFMNTLTLPRAYRTELQFFKSLNNKNILIIEDRPGQFTVHEFGAVNFDYANKNPEEILGNLKNHLYQDIYAVQELITSTGKVSADTRLDPVYKLESVLEQQNGEDSHLKISRVILDPRADIFSEKKEKIKKRKNRLTKIPR